MLTLLLSTFTQLNHYCIIFYYFSKSSVIRQKGGISKIRTWDPGPGTLRLGTLGHSTLTPRTLVMGPWD